MADFQSTVFNILINFSLFVVLVVLVVLSQVKDQDIDVNVISDFNVNPDDFNI